MKDQTPFFWQKIELKNFNIDSSDLKKIHDLLQARLDIIHSRDKAVWERNNPGADEKARTEVMNLGEFEYRVHSTVRFSDGESISKSSSDLFAEITNWAKVDSVSLDASWHFRVRTKNDFDPSARIEFFFRDPAIWSPVAIVSSGTMNASYVQISGSDRDWCARTKSELMSLFEKCRNYRNVLHSKFTFDIISNIIVMPIILLVAYRNNDYIKSQEPYYSIAFIILSVIILFSFVSIIVRILFDFARWLLPTIEMKDAVSTISLIRICIAACPFGALMAIGMRLF